MRSGASPSLWTPGGGRASWRSGARATRGPWLRRVTACWAIRPTSSARRSWPSGSPRPPSRCSRAPASTNSRSTACRSERIRIGAAGFLTVGPSRPPWGVATRCWPPLCEERLRSLQAPIGLHRGAASRGSWRSRLSIAADLLAFRRGASERPRREIRPITAARAPAGTRRRMVAEPGGRDTIVWRDQPLPSGWPPC